MAGERRYRNSEEILQAPIPTSSRKNGATRAELVELTGWSGAPWKWLFANPKGNGYCDRHGYHFEVIQRASGEVAYKVTRS